MCFFVKYFGKTTLLLVGFFDLFAVSLVVTQLQTYIRQLGVSHISVGIIGSLYGAVQLISSPLVGNCSDRKGRKKTLQICLLATAVSYLFLGFRSFLGLIIFSRIFSGICKHSQSLCRAYVAENSLGNEKAHMLGYFNSASSIGFIIGPAVGGYLAEMENGFFYISMFSSLLFCINFCIVSIFVPNDKPLQEVTAKNSTFFPLLSIDCWKSHWDILLVRFFLSFSILVFRNNFSLLLHENFHLSYRSIGFIISFQSIISSFSGMFVGAIFAIYQNSLKLLLHSSLLQIIALLGVLYSLNVWFLIIFLVPLSISNSIGRVCITSLTVERCKKSELGTMIGLGQSITSLARMISPFSAGLAQQMSIYGPGFVGVASSIIGVCILVFDFYFHGKEHVE